MNSPASPSSGGTHESLSDAVERVMSESQDWLRILGQEADTPITVYLDMKSPHAYILSLIHI